MKNNKIAYKFKDNPRLWPFSPSTWCPYVALPKEMAIEIRENLKWQEEGWGRMKAIAKIGNSEWQTSIWFDTKHDTYILPIKAEIRKKEKIEIDKKTEISIWV
jgi:hypothetical protein